MAIQLPDPGLGDGKTGDNQYVAWTKIKDNFSNTTHAASRLVGTGVGNLTPAEDLYKVTFGRSSIAAITDGDLNNTLAVGKYSAIDRTVNTPSQGFWLIDTFSNVGVASNALSQLAYGRNGKQDVAYRQYTGSSWAPWAIFYTTANTTKDVATGFIKASSPVLHVYNDSITKIHEAEQLDITVDKKGTGHYEIHGTTGLRKNDGWFMSPPRDMHSNVLCMVDFEEKDGVIILKTYKKKFDFETVSIVHDYDNPMDIPEGACVEFRFNDLPQEQLDESIE